MNGNHSMVEILASQYNDEFKNIVKDEFHDLLTLAVKACDKANFKRMLSVFPTFSSDSEQIRDAYAAIVKESEAKLVAKKKSKAKLEELNSGGLDKLFDAIEKGNTEEFVDAFDKLGIRKSKAILIFPSEKPWFHVAASKGYDEIVEHIASNLFASFLHKDGSGDTPLHVAAKGGHLSTFQKLLDLAKEEGKIFFNDHNDCFLLKAKNKQGHTVLHVAVKNGYPEILDFIASNYTDMFKTIVKDNSEKLLLLAVKAYDKASFHKIFSVFESDKIATNPFVASLRYHVTDREFKLIEEAYIKITKEERGNLPALDATLHNEKDKAFEAAKRGNTNECLDALSKLQRSVISRCKFMKIVNKGDPSKNSLLHVAASNGNDELVEVIVSKFFAMFHPITVDTSRPFIGDNPLHLAAKGGHFSTFQKLLDLAKEEGQYFGRPNASLLLKTKNEKGHTTLHEAVMNGNHVIVEFFASQYKIAFEEVVRDDYEKLLILAVKSYDKASFKKMLPVLPRHSSDLKTKLKKAYCAIIKEHGEGKGKSDKLNCMEDNSTHGGLFIDANTDVGTFRDAFIKLKAKGGQSILEILNKGSSSGNSLLHEAASCGNHKIVKYIASGFFAQVFNKNWQQDTPLHVAARNDHNKNWQQDTPLHVAARNDHRKTLEILLCEAEKEGAYFGIEGRDYTLVKEKNKQSQTALHEAVLDGKADTVAFIVDRYGEIFDEYKDKDHPLKTAIKYNDTEILKVLLPALKKRHSSYSHVDATKEAHRSVMFDVAHAAIVNGTDTFQKMLEEIPSIVHLTDTDGRSLLHWAAELDNLIAVKKLLEVSERKRTVFRADNSGKYPIHIACEQGHVGILKQFMQTQRKTLTREKQNILHVAAENGNDEIVQYILKTLETGDIKELVKQEDQHGNTPLHLAAENSHPNVVLSLARYKKDTLNLKNKEGFTPLDVFWRSKKNESALRHSLTSSALRLLGCGRSWESEDGRDKGYHSKKRKWERTDSRWIKNQVAALSTAATLVATVTFTAGFTVPGGYNGSDGQDKGIAALLHKAMFRVFTVSNTLSFFLSILSILSSFYATDHDDRVSENAFSLAKRFFGIALFTMGLAFLAAVFLGVSKLTWLACLILVIGSLFLIIIFFFESLQSLVPYLMDIPYVRYIPYSITRAMTSIFVKDHAG